MFLEASEQQFSCKQRLILSVEWHDMIKDSLDSVKNKRNVTLIKNNEKEIYL